jgi:hypothetical protein
VKTAELTAALLELDSEFVAPDYAERLVEVLAAHDDGSRDAQELAHLAFLAVRSDMIDDGADVEWAESLAQDVADAVALVLDPDLQEEWQ